MYLKNIILLFSLFLLLHERSNAQFLNDTIVIEEIVVRNRAKSVVTEFKNIHIDSTVLSGYRHGSLSDVLTDNSLLYIKSYGPGSLATPSFRGTGAGNTIVTWNGSNISSPMLGQSDLSLIAAGMVDEISIISGSGSLASNTGGIGGIINIASGTTWKKEKQLILNPGAGSFGRYDGLIKFQAGNEKFQSVSRAFINSAENDFKFYNQYLSNIPVEQRRENASLFRTGLMQEFYFKKGRTSSSAHFWYQSSNRNLPVSMIVQQPASGEKQYDSFFRSLLQHKIYNEITTFNITFSLFTDKLNYINSLADINSKNISNTFSVKAGFETKPAGGTTLKGSVSDDLIIINSNNYEGNKTRNLISLYGSAGQDVGDRAELVIMIRQNILGGKFSIPDFSMGLSYKPLNNSGYFIRGNITRNSRIPTMNDMYWIPGGNPDLKNEYSYGYEMIFELNDKIGRLIDIRSVATAFNNHIHNMIQWLPGERLYWSPRNIGSIRTAGIDSDLEISLKQGPFSIITNAGYSLTLARKSDQSFFNGTDYNQQLVYVPVHQVNSNIKIYYRNFYGSWIYNFTGKRFISADNSQYLNAYSLSDFVLGFKIKLNNNIIDINAKCSNITGTNYEAVSFYPMPGRSLFISVLYKFIK